MKRLIGIYSVVLMAASLSLAGEDTLHLNAVMELPSKSFEALGKRTAVPYVFGDEKWDQWGCGVVKGDDDKYHMYYARWPRAYGHNAWLTHSEIAHAVAHKPEGPYTYVDTALSRRGGEWDAIQAHNPKIQKFATAPLEELFSEMINAGYPNRQEM